MLSDNHLVNLTSLDNTICDDCSTVWSCTFNSTFWSYKSSRGNIYIKLSFIRNISWTLINYRVKNYLVCNFTPVTCSQAVNLDLVKCIWTNICKIYVNNKELTSNTKSLIYSIVIFILIKVISCKIRTKVSAIRCYNVCNFNTSVWLSKCNFTCSIRRFWK